MSDRGNLHAPQFGPARSTSNSLIRRVRSYDQEAWERLTKLYGPLVYGWARTAGLQPEAAGDIVQETFQAAAKAIDKFEHRRNGGSFRGWLRVIARNCIAYHFRRENQQPQATGGTAAHGLLEQVGARAPQERPTISRAKTSSSPIEL